MVTIVFKILILSPQYLKRPIYPVGRSWEGGDDTAALGRKINTLNEKMQIFCSKTLNY